MTVRSAARGLARRGHRAARHGSRSRVGVGVATGGLCARGVLMLALAVIIIRLVAVRSQGEADRRGALEALIAGPGGRALVAVCALAFAGHAVWRWLEAAGGLDHDRGELGVVKRIGFVAAGGLYLALCVSCVSVLAGSSSGSEEGSSQRAAAQLFGLPLGRPLLGLAGAGLIAGGIGLAVWTARRGFEVRLHVEAMGPAVRRVVRWLEYPGQAARATLLLIAGGLLVRGAAQSDPGQARGLDGTLRTLAAQPFGRVLLAAVSLGLAAFGVVSFLEARYLRTNRDTVGAGRRR